MSKFNEKASTRQKEEMLCGAEGYKMSPELELYSIICTSLLTPQYYVPNTNDQLNRIKNAMKNVDPTFVAQLAVYAREKMNLRTIPLVLDVELAKIHNGDNLVRRLTKRVVNRADEITELVAYYKKSNSRKIPAKHMKMKGSHVVEKSVYKLSNQLKKGLSDIFESGKFDEYNYAKYNRKTDVQLRDVLFLTHPKPKTDNQKELFSKIANNNLSTPYTWETQLSEAGQSDRSKKAVWEKLILSGKIGYMALLRNLANFLREDVSEALMEKVCRRLEDGKEVAKSKQFPFRFLSVYRRLVGDPTGRFSWGSSQTEFDLNKPVVQRVIHALETAVLHSVNNMPIFHNERVLLATDVSGSMQSTISERSSVQSYDIGALLAMLSQTVCYRSVVGMFGDSFKVLHNLPKENVLEATQEIHRREGEVGYSTNGYKVLNWALSDSYTNKPFDRIMMFTDCQMYGNNTDGVNISEFWKAYKERAPYAKLYLFNLAPYGQAPLKLEDNDVYLISGWSDAIFTVIKNIEKGEDALDEVRKIDI